MSSKQSIIQEAQEVIARLQAPGLDDPYPLYAWLRENAPVVHSQWHDAYLVSRYTDCARVFRSPDEFTSPENDTLMELMPQSVEHQDYRNLFSSLLGGEPLPYTPIRRLVATLLTPDVVRHIRDGMRRIRDDVLDVLAAADDGNPVDLHNAVSVPVGRQALSALIGADSGEQPEISKLMPQMLRVMQVPPTRPALAAAATAFTVLADYLAGLLASRRGAPQKDLATLMSVASNTMSTDEVRTTLITLWATGFEKAVAMVDIAVLALLRQPELIDWVRDEEMAAAFVDELSRWDTPGQMSTSPRYAAAEIELGGTVIPAGAEVRLLLGSANRDPEVFTEPDRLLPGRIGPVPLVSGAGFQLCVGTSLALLQMCVLLPGLVERFPELHLAGEPEWRRSMPVRELRTIPVRLGVHADRRSTVPAGLGSF